MRQSKLSFAAARVVMASQVLSLGEKIVWLEDRALDLGPEGAWIAPATFERRWGQSLTAATISEYRRRLRLYGLHEQVPRPGARSPGWVSTLPDRCIPRSSRPTDEEIEALAVQLDAHLQARAAPNQDRAQTPTGIVLSAQRGLDAAPNVGRREGGRGEGSPSASERSETPLPSVVRQSGVRARARVKSEKPLTPEELADFRNGIERDHKAGKITAAQRDLMLRMAVGL